MEQELTVAALLGCPVAPSALFLPPNSATSTVRRAQTDASDSGLSATALPCALPRLPLRSAAACCRAPRSAPRLLHLSREAAGGRGQLRSGV